MVAAFALVALFAVLLGRMMVASPIATADRALADFFITSREAALLAFFSWFTLFGEWYSVAVISALTALLLWRWKKYTYILPLFVALAGNEFVVEVAKILVHRARPIGGAILKNGFSFPSGHAALAGALYGFLAYALCRETSSRGRKIFIITGSALLTILMGLSRVYLGVHYVSDVIGGYGIGLSTAGIAAWVSARSNS